MTSTKENQVSEQITITTHNQIIQEKALLKSNQISEYVFINISCMFSSSLFIQLLNFVNVDKNVLYRLPIIFLSSTLIIVGISFALKKQPTLKLYLLFASILMGLIVGC
jgi:hypothetical protein